jgi:energy-coupling factor transporter ATP-binding protein EcfA2
MNFCGLCWDRQIVHKRPHQGVLRQGPPHEKTSPDIAAKVHDVLSPPKDEKTRERLYEADAPTAWFGTLSSSKPEQRFPAHHRTGVERPDDSSTPTFVDYGRFTELMEATDPVRKNPIFMEQWSEIGRDQRTPSLVSFVGQTGAGKSSLIKLLINFATSGMNQYPAPVVGPRGAHVPTSEDVHLYMDPETADSPGPLLYADCEGLEGGEREPLGAKFKRKRRLGSGREADIEATLMKSRVISERELQWAHEPRARSREFAVANLYPRLLYTFSDVIVFVLRNPRQVFPANVPKRIISLANTLSVRVIEHVFERLVQWAAAAIETSSNQPVLPHAIIALNASENGLEDNKWKVSYNTENILYDLQHTVNSNETFKKWAQFWRERGKKIDGLLDLIICYYSSIQVRFTILQGFG